MFWNHSSKSQPLERSLEMAEHWAHNSYFPANFDKVKLAHCLAGAAAWVILFPLGAILLRTLNSPRAVRVHYIIQICATCIFIACVGMGIWMAKWIHKVSILQDSVKTSLTTCLSLTPHIRSSAW